VVPLTSTIRGFHSEITVEADEANGLDQVSAAQCQHLRAISPRQVVEVRGNIGFGTPAQLRDMIAVILGLL